MMRRADVRRRLGTGWARAGLVRAVGLRHSVRRWNADRALDAHAPARRKAFVEEMWAEAAAAAGATIEEIAPRFFEFRRGDAIARVVGERTPFADAVAVELASAKDVAYRLLAEAGVVLPEHVVLQRGDDAAAFALLEAGGPVVVKPARGGGAGQGVTTSVATPRQLAQALHRAGLTSEVLIVERQLPGEHYRILLLDGVVLDVLERRRPFVVGNGGATIEELMFAEYDRRLDDTTNWKPFAVDLDCLFALELQGLGLSSVPAAGDVVEVKGATNISGRRECATYTGPVAPGVADAARAASEALGVRLAGVDVVTPDISAPLGPGSGALLEVNPIPGLFHHYNVADRDAASKVAIPILEALLAPHTA